MTKRNNRTILELSKVQHGILYYVNQEGLVSNYLFKTPSVRGRTVSDAEMAYPHPDYPGETTLARAKRLNVLDVWTPVCKFQLTANHNIEFTGDKALTMYDAWCARIFGKKKGKK